MSDTLFSILLNEMLAAVEQQSTKHGNEGDEVWSKAVLKVREAQTILVNLDLLSEDTWESDSRCGMEMLNERCEGDISPGITFVEYQTSKED